MQYHQSIQFYISIIKYEIFTSAFVSLASLLKGSIYCSAILNDTPKVKIILYITGK